MSHLHRFTARNAASIWQLEGRWLRARGTFRAPAAVQWITTSACDLTCAHCYSVAGRRHPDELDTTEALALVDELAALECRSLVLAGGEPLLRPDLERIVAYAHERGIGWSLHTHGGLVRRKRELFERFPPELVAVSLDGPRALHDAIRGRAGSFEGALDALAFLRDETATKQVVAGTTVTRRNADHIADLAPVVMASRAHVWGLHLFAPEGRGAEHTELLPTPGQLRRAASLVRRLRRLVDVDLDNEWGSAGDLDPFFRDQPFLCGAGRFTAVIAANGDIMPCTTTDRAEAEGNVRTHALRDVWRTGFARFREPGDAVCADGHDCWLQTRHGNSCRAAAFGIEPEPLLPADLPAPRGRGGLRAAALALLAVAAPVQAAPTGDFPSELDPVAWAGHNPHLFGEDGLRHDSGWTRLKELSLLRRPLQSDPVLPATTAMLAEAHGGDPKRLLAVLDEAEAAHVWDPWLAAQVWQRSSRVQGPPKDLVALYARVLRHVRVVDALVLAHAETGPVRYLPWRRKSAAPEGYKAMEVSPDLLAAAQKHFAVVDGGTWVREATVLLELTEGEATLWRDGKEQALEVGATVTLTRLDVVVLDGAMRHAEAGKVVHGRKAVTARDLPLFLHWEAGAYVKKKVEAALEGDRSAVDQLGAVLPVAHRAIRSGVARAPDAEGAPALRTLLALFEE